MRKPLLVLCLFISISTFAQDWQLFPEGQRNYYKQNSEYLDLSSNTMVFEDVVYSVKLNYAEIIGNQTHLHYAKIGELSQFCIEKLLDDFYIEAFPKHFYNLRNLTFENGEYKYQSEVIDNNGEFLLKNNAQIGDSWSTANGTVNIECINTSTMDVYGEIDDIKTYMIQSGDYSGQEIILSKNHGLIQYIPFYAFFETSQIHEPFIMIGIENEDDIKGNTLPYFNEYFPYSAGDKRYVKHTYESAPGPDYEYTIRYSIDSILSVNHTDSSVNFTSIDISTDEDFNYINTSPIRHGQYLNNKGFENIRTSNWFTNEEYITIDVGNITIEDQNNTPVYTLNSRYQQIVNTNDGCSGFFDYILDYFYFVSYSTQYGFTYRYNSSWGNTGIGELIGTCIGGVTNGTTFTVDTDDIQLTQNTIYPNPATNQIFIKLEEDKSQNYTLYNVLGQSIIQGQLQSSQIDVENLPRGVYFLKLDGYRAEKVVLE